MNCTDIDQCALFVSSGDKKPEEIVKLILGEKAESLPVLQEKDIQAFRWHIDTKYYDADVYLCALGTKTLTSQELAASVQAVIIYFNSNQNNGLQTVESWLPFLKEYEAEVKIMVCSRCDENPTNGVSKLAAQEWCVENGFELVELDPELNPEWEEEQDFLETTGIKRVIQALHAHVWPNLTMKERKEPTSMNGLLHCGLPPSEEASISEEFENLDLETEIDAANIEAQIEAFASGNSDMDFSTLFGGGLMDMRVRLQYMSTDQRRAYAERIALAFWNAIDDSDEVP